ncbi:MAG TPA: arsenate reductase (glutaredoxin) [Acidimicrobiales bacterium]|nr:arsenate reductase (glutaredoxin) [Acidimicrobiales bacterium]
MASGAEQMSIYFNPACSKCRTARGLLAERGIEAQVIDYLEVPPTVDELKALMVALGITDPRDMMRTGEAIYSELGLGTHAGEDLLEAVVEHPILLERPIVVHHGRAVIARPPDRLLELL